MNREEAASVIKELFVTCEKMDEVYLCMMPPTGSTPIATIGYQIHIKTTPAFDKKTIGCIESVTKKHKLTAQAIKDSEKIIIFREH